MNKLLFGSGFPNASAAHCIEELYGISHLVHGTNLPTIPREQLRSIVERDALKLLGITLPTPRS
jgi:predicted TIM-barrel fold metal-dependent hydrolase